MTGRSTGKNLVSVDVQFVGKGEISLLVGFKEA